MKTGTACTVTPEEKEERGIAWVLGSFVLCPCHLPITLWAVGAILSGTVLGALLRAHLILAGTAVSILWLAGTLHGLDLVRRARAEARESGPRFRLFHAPE